jgi:hypothetical protein
VMYYFSNYRIRKTKDKAKGTSTSQKDIPMQIRQAVHNVHEVERGVFFVEMPLGR